MSSVGCLHALLLRTYDDYAVHSMCVKVIFLRLGFHKKWAHGGGVPWSWYSMFFMSYLATIVSVACSKCTVHPIHASDYHSPQSGTASRYFFTHSVCIKHHSWTLTHTPKSSGQGQTPELEDSFVYHNRNREEFFYVSCTADSTDHVTEGWVHKLGQTSFYWNIFAYSSQNRAFMRKNIAHILYFL